MVEKMGHIRNPLTIIAIFAALAEVSGTVVLPFLDTDLQHIYVWFLMLFPAVLILAFFITLNFNRRALYAPSDFREEKHFVDLASPASAEAREEKLQIEVEQLKRMEEKRPTAGILPFPASIPIFSSSIAERNQADEKRRSKVALSEALALQLISGELGIPVVPSVKLTGRYPSQAILFDGVIEKEDSLKAIEIKYFPNGYFQTSEIREFFSKAERLHFDIKEKEHKELSLIFAVVTDEDAARRTRIHNRISASAGRYSMPIEVRVYAADALVETVEKNLRAKPATA